MLSDAQQRLRAVQCKFVIDSLRSLESFIRTPSRFLMVACVNESDKEYQVIRGREAMTSNCEHLASAFAEIDRHADLFDSPLSDRLLKEAFLLQDRLNCITSTSHWEFFTDEEMASSATSILKDCADRISPLEELIVDLQVAVRDMTEGATSEAADAEGARENPQYPATAPRKRSGRKPKSERDANLIVLANLRRWHRYEPGCVANDDPAPSSELAIGTSSPSVSRAISKFFGSRKKYEAACRNGTLAGILTLHSGDVPPRALVEYRDSKDRE